MKQVAEANITDTVTDLCEPVNPKFQLETKTAHPAMEMRRVQESWVACGEQKVLLWLAARIPQWANPDHLTALGLAAQIGAGACYALARWNKNVLVGVIVFLALNWLGDSLDGTLARVRQKLRPRYGFYEQYGLCLLLTSISSLVQLRLLVSRCLTNAL